MLSLSKQPGRSKQNWMIRDTENINPMSSGMDALPVGEFLQLMHASNKEAFDAVGPALPELEKVVKCCVQAIRSGGRVFYIGAGTSGRLGVMDASEVKPTFGSNSFGAVIAGGAAAMTKAVEGAEDDQEAARAAADSLNGQDVAIGIAASGTTPFVIAFLKRAKEKGGAAWLISSNEVEYGFLDGVVQLLTGPELIAGSTRLKAATAQKLCLNLISTAVMVQLGKVYNGYMVDVVPGNKKLVERAKRIISSCTGCDEEEAGRYLEMSGMKPKLAIVMLAKKAPREEAERLLSENDGRLRGLI